MQHRLLQPRTGHRKQRPCRGPVGVVGAGMVGAGVDAEASCEDVADATVGSPGDLPLSSAASGSPMSADTVRGMPARLASSHKIARAKATSCCVDNEGTCRRSMGCCTKGVATRTWYTDYTRAQ